MLRAEPVMNAAMEVREMRSTIHPNLKKPRAAITEPQMMAIADASSWPGTFGCVFAASNTIVPTSVETTATGWMKIRRTLLNWNQGPLTPIVISFDVAKNQ
jgi:hypothetical protein